MALWAGGFAARLAVGAVVNLVLAVGAYAVRVVDRSGAVAGALLGTAVWGCLGWRGFRAARGLRRSRQRRNPARLAGQGGGRPGAERRRPAERPPRLRQYRGRGGLRDVGRHDSLPGRLHPRLRRRPRHRRRRHRRHRDRPAPRSPRDPPHDLAASTTRHPRRGVGRGHPRRRPRRRDRRLSRRGNRSLRVKGWSGGCDRRRSPAPSSRASPDLPSSAETSSATTGSTSSTPWSVRWSRRRCHPWSPTSEPHRLLAPARRVSLGTEHWLSPDLPRRQFGSRFVRGKVAS